MARQPANEADRIEREVRRRVAEALAELGVLPGGIGSHSVDVRDRISHEILYLLPEEFVREYVRLYNMALEHDRGTAMGKMGKDEGRQVRTGARSSSGNGRVAGKMYRQGAQVTGKRYMNLPISVRSEKALNAKQALDRKLVRGVRRAIVDARRDDDDERDERVEKCGECGRIR